MATCKCNPWKRGRGAEYERRCRIGKRSFLASTVTWAGDVTVILTDSAGESATQEFPHVGPRCRIDEAKVYADAWLKMKCAAASGSVSGCRRCSR